MSRKPPPDDTPPQPMEGKIYGRDEQTPADEAEEKKEPTVTYHMPVVRQPPTEGEGVWSGITRGVSNWTEKRVATGYQKAFTAYEGMINAATAVGQAIMHHERVARQLGDIEKVLDADQKARDEEHMKAEMDHWDAEMTYTKKKIEYDRFKAGDPPEDDLGKLSESQQEFKKHLIEEDDEQFEQIIEEHEQSFIRKCGGFDNMTEKEKEKLKKIRRSGEKLMKDQER